MKQMNDKQLRWLRWVAFDNRNWLEKELGLSYLLYIQGLIQKREYGTFDIPLFNMVKQSFMTDGWMVNKWKAKLKLER